MTALAVVAAEKIINLLHGMRVCIYQLSSYERQSDDSTMAITVVGFVSNPPSGPETGSKNSIPRVPRSQIEDLSLAVYIMNQGGQPVFIILTIDFQ